MITTEELVKRVRVLINEAEEDKTIELLSENTCSFDKSIRALLPQAVNIVQNNCLGRKRVNTRAMKPNRLVIVFSGTDCGYIAVPADFVSLVSIKLDCWERGCTRLYPEFSPIALWQCNVNTRARRCRPVCVEELDETGNKIIGLYPLSDGAKLEHFVYEASFDHLDGLDGYDNGMDDAVAYQCAALLYNVFEKYDAANLFMSLSVALYNGLPVKK
jgi:hypothetical protein